MNSESLFFNLQLKAFKFNKCLYLPATYCATFMKGFGLEILAIVVDVIIITFIRVIVRNGSSQNITHFSSICTTIFS